MGQQIDMGEGIFMYEAAAMLNIGMTVLLAMLSVSVCLLIYIHIKGRHQSCEKLQRYAKIFSFAPLIFNACLFIVFVIGQLLLSEFSAMMFLIVICYGASVSAVLGPCIEVFGLYFSILYTAKCNRKAIGYIVASGTALVISLLFLSIYLSALIPLALSYYGI